MGRIRQGITMSDQPGYTRVPNAILDSMADLTEPELRVLLAITRKTIGWQKECDLISLTQLEGITGLSRPAVNKALHTVMARGWVECTGRGKQRTGCYKLTELVNDVNRSDQLTLLTSKPELLVSVNDVNRSSTQLVNDVNTQKKEYKEKKDNDRVGRKATTRTPKESIAEVIILTLADVCKIDRQVATKPQRDQLYQSAGILSRAGAKQDQNADQIADTIRYVANYYERQHWKGKKGQPPTPAIIREIWREAIDARSTNGVYTNGKHIRQSTERNPERKPQVEADLTDGFG